MRLGGYGRLTDQTSAWAMTEGEIRAVYDQALDCGPGFHVISPVPQANRPWEMGVDPVWTGRLARV